jgi:ketosteroid isomerase-like protein
MINPARATAAIAVTILLTAAAPAARVDPAPIVAAERAFAADGAVMGVGPSFLKHSTADSIVIGPGGVNKTKDAFGGPPPPGPQPLLAWWPLWAGIAQSGDLGFTSGPVEVGGVRQGHYFTVWKKQPDGGWKWIYDGGAGATALYEAPATTQPIYLGVSTAKPIAASKAMQDVDAAEKRFADQARTDQKAAFAAALAADGRIYVAPRPPALGSVAVAEALGGYPKAMDFSPPAGGEASKAGDLAYVHGPVKWQGPNGPAAGHYVHVWQRRSNGLKLVFAQIVPARGS